MSASEKNKTKYMGYSVGLASAQTIFVGLETVALVNAVTKTEDKSFKNQAV